MIYGIYVLLHADRGVGQPYVAPQMHDRLLLTDLVEDMALAAAQPGRCAIFEVGCVDTDTGFVTSVHETISAFERGEALVAKRRRVSGMTRQ